MANQWFKFYGGEYLCDPKILQLNGDERSCWVTLLALASQTDDGLIRFLSEGQLRLMSGVLSGVEVLEKFEKLQMIRNDNGDVTILNWQKRQEHSLTPYERVKRYREKKKKDNAVITTEENRIEENRIDNTNTVVLVAPTPQDKNRDFFEGGEEYTKLLDLFALQADRGFLEREFKNFILYWTEPNKSGTKVKWEQQPTFDTKRRLYTWLSRKNEWAKISNKGKAVV